MAKESTDKKTYPDNGKGYNALGNLSGRLETLEFKDTKKGGTWASFSVKSGKSSVRGTAFSPKLIPVLEGFSEGDDISLFGKLTSQYAADGEKIYTSFTAFSANDDMNPSVVTVAGEVIGTASTEYADYADLDVTQDDNYPAFVRIKLSGEVDMSDFSEGSKVRVSCEPQGKYGEFTVVKMLPFLREKGSGINTGTKPGDRFKRTQTPVAPAAVTAGKPASAATGKVVSAKLKMSTEDFTKDF